MAACEKKDDTCLSWLLLSDVPPGTVIGLDANVWTVGCKFRGIRDIPLGLHYFFSNAAASGPEGKSVSGLRCSVFFNLSKPSVIKKRWDRKAEEFVDLTSTEADLDLIRSTQSEVAMYLGVYPKERFANWIALSSYITLDTVNRLQPSGKYIFSCAQFRSEKSLSSDRACLPIPDHLRRDNQEVVGPESIATGEKLLPKLKRLPETELHWTDLPQHPLYPPGSSSTEISQHNIDQTYTLNKIILQLESLSEDSPSFGGLSSGEARLLGEFHFAFVVFLLGEVLEGWYHWRRLLSLLANCERAVIERPRLYKALITSLYRLLIYNEEHGNTDTNESKPLHCGAGGCEWMGSPYFDEWQGCHNTEPAFLPYTISRLFENILEARGTAKKMAPSNQVRLVLDVFDRAEGLRNCLERRFNVRLAGHRLRDAVGGELSVDEVDWDTDEAPIIVDD